MVLLCSRRRCVRIIGRMSSGLVLLLLVMLVGMSRGKFRREVWPLRIGSSRDEKFVNTWKELIGFLDQVPKFPDVLLFYRPDGAPRQVSVHRMGDTDQFFSFISVEEDELDQLDSHRFAVYTEYTVSTKSPLVFRRIDCASDKTTEEVKPRTTFLSRIRKNLLMYRLYKDTGIMTPSHEELASLVIHLKNSDSRIIRET